MRLHLRGLFQRHRSQDRGGDSICAYRAVKKPPACSRRSMPSLAQSRATPEHGGQRGSSAARRGACGCRTDARQARREIAFASRTKNSTKKVPARKPGTSTSISPRRASATPSAIHLAFTSDNEPHSSMPSSPRSHAPPDFPIAGLPCATSCPKASLSARRPICCFSLSPSITGGERRQKAQGACDRRRSAAMPRRSMSLRRWKNSPASGPIRRPLSKRSIRCNRGSIP